MGDNFDEIIRQKLDDYRDEIGPNANAMDDMFHRLGPIGPKAVAIAWLKSNAVSLALAASVVCNIAFIGLYQRQDAKIAKMEAQIEKLIATEEIRGTSSLERNKPERQKASEDFANSSVNSEQASLNPIPLNGKVQREEEEGTKSLPPATTTESLSDQTRVTEPVNSEARTPPKESFTHQVAKHSDELASNDISDSKERVELENDRIIQKIDVEKPIQEKSRTESDFIIKPLEETMPEPLEANPSLALSDREVKELEKSSKKSLKEYEKSLKRKPKYSPSNREKAADVNGAQEDKKEIIGDTQSLKKWRFGIVAGIGQTSLRNVEVKSKFILGIKGEYALNSRFRISMGIEDYSFKYFVNVNRVKFKKPRFDRLPFKTSQPPRIYQVENQLWNFPLQFKYMLPVNAARVLPYFSAGINNQLVSSQKFSRSLLTNKGSIEQSIRTRPQEFRFGDLLLEAGIEIPLNKFAVQLSAFFQKDNSVRNPEQIKFNTVGIKTSFLLTK